MPGAISTVAPDDDDDIQTVELAWVPPELRAPTTWTIAKGVFLGLLLWSLFVGLLWLVVYALALSSVREFAP